MRNKYVKKILVGVVTASMIVGTALVPAAAAEQELEAQQEFEAQPQSEAQAESEVEPEDEVQPEEALFSEAEKENDEVFSQGEGADIFTDDNTAQDSFGETAEEISVSGLPVLTESISDDIVDAIPLAQYLALGDSISTGFGLTDVSGSFVNLLAQKSGYTVSNAAVDGAVSQAVLALLMTGKLDAQVSGAEVITLTIGGNDMMAALYQMVAQTYNEASGDTITAMDVPVILSDAANPRNAALTAVVVKILSGGYDQVKPAFAAVLQQMGENLKNMAAYMKSKNPEAVILVANQYNPYKWLSGPYAAFGLFFEGGVADINAQITNPENGAGTAYTVVDVYSAFAASQENLSNASSLPLNLDFHPNSKGHEVLAAAFEKELPKEEPPKVELSAPVIEKVTAPGNKVSVALTEKVSGADAYDFVISKDSKFVESGKYLQASKDQKDLNAEFYYVPKGTYYVFSRAYAAGSDGTKQYGNWSEPAKITVSAVTPQQPRITSVKVKGSTVTVTYKVCKNATGYDVVLGSQVKSVHGEKRPVSYGNYVAKAKKGNKVTVTFKNVKKGTYYAGLHAYNRTSEDNKKVFSKWSPAKKLVVK